MFSTQKILCVDGLGEGGFIVVNNNIESEFIELK